MRNRWVCRNPEPGFPTATTAPGIFVAGTAAGPKDIVDTISEAGAAAMQASRYLQANNATAPTT